MDEVPARERAEKPVDMRLSDEPSGQKHSILSDEPEVAKPLHMKALHRASTFLVSSDGVTVSWALVTFAIVSIIMSMDFWAMPSIIENDISTQSVYAAYDLKVEDRAATKQKRQQAQQDVLPVYKSVPQINSSVRENIIDLIKQLEPLSQDHNQSPEARKEAFANIVGNASGTEAAFKHLDHFTSPMQWDRLRYLTQVTTDNILQDGLSETDYVERRDAIIKKAMPNSGYSQHDIEMAEFLVSIVIKPNRYIDMDAWKKAQDQAAKQIKPEYTFFKKGQKIMDRGELMTPLQLSALEAMGKSPKGVNWPATMGVILISAIFAATLWGYLYHYERREFFKPTFGALMSILTVTILLLVRVAQQNEWPLVALPLASFALLVSIFTHPRIGILASTLTVFLIGITMKLDFSVLAILLFGSVIGVYVLSRKLNFNDRTQLMFAGVYVGLSNVALLLSVQLLGTTPFVGDWKEMSVPLFWTFFISGIGSGVLTFGSLPYLESLFRLVTPFTLMELGNHDKPLLKRMQFEAPGTFHHSLMVATLAEAAAEEIGANPLLARVGSLYHDIGKMKRPLFFIENQAYFGVENPHDRLTPRLSKMVVTAHPRDSVEMAKHYHLPEVLMKFMTEHHGTLMAGYFYNQACIQEGEENVNKSQFRYPGPKPNIKETAICMMADACESAVRALKSPTPSQIEERIDKIIKQRVDDGQFDNCPITFKDIRMIRDTFVRVIRGIQHNRIEYQQTVMRELGRKINGQEGAGKGNTPIFTELQPIEIRKSSTSGSGSAVPPPAAKKETPSKPQETTSSADSHNDIDPCC